MKEKMLILNFILGLFKTVLHLLVFPITITSCCVHHKLTADLSEGPVCTADISLPACGTVY